jgi:catechol 2,3-dioxygenase-like lactoylglutathione lyase family enzyme
MHTLLNVRRALRIAMLAVALCVPIACVASIASVASAQATQALRMRHVSLFTAQNETLAQWYVDMLGLKRDTRFVLTRPDGVRIDVIRLRLGDFLMHVSQLDNLTPRQRQLEYTGWRHIALVVDDVDAAWAALKAKGADVAGNGGLNFNPPGYRVSFVRDPDGNFIELYQDQIK